MNKMNVFLYFPEKQSPSPLSGNHKALEHLLERIYCEQESRLYYHDANVSAFIELLIPDKQDNYENTQIGVLILECLSDSENIEDSLQHESNASYSYTLAITPHTTFVEENTSAASIFCEAAYYKEQFKEQKTVVFDVYAQIRPVHLYRSIPVLKDWANATDASFPVLIHVDYIQGRNLDESLNVIDHWLQENRTLRLLNKDDKRHRVGNSVKSRLLYNFRDTTAAAKGDILLKGALTDPYSENHKQVLYNYDHEHDCYIRFEDENTTPPQYHCYHITDTDKRKKSDGESIIPSRVKELLDKLRDEKWWEAKLAELPEPK